MHLPYSRPRLFEIADQSWCPPFIRAQCQAVLTFLWLHRIPPLQRGAPYLGAAEVLGRLVREVEKDDGEKGERRKLRVVDCCSGAGGPMPAIEEQMNERRTAAGRPPVPVLLSDLHPHLPAWSRSTSLSPTRSLSFISEPVDATRAPPTLSKEKHIRTFCLAFHHFGEDAARRVLEDTMRTAEAICIFELQEPVLGSFLTICGVFPLTFLVTPFTRPSLLALIFTYVIPLIPIIIVVDGLISTYRTRSLDHVQYLANLASMALSLEGGDRESGEWSWVEGRRRHTWPFGNLFYIVGRKERGDEGEEEEVDEELDAA